MRRDAPYGYCQRTSRRVRLSQLREDGELPGLLVHPFDADPEHPQKILKPLYPDHVIRHPAPPYAAIGATVRLGALGNPETGAAITNPSMGAALTGVTISTEDDAGNGYGVDGYGQGPWSQ